MDTLHHDPRVAKKFMASSPVPTFFICLAYLVFVKILGPAWMKDRKPFDLKGLLIVYNSVLVIVSVYLFYLFGRYGWFWRYSWTCANIDFLETEESLAIVQACYYFFWSKFLVMADTVFFILRKKDSQITFLHVVHHSSVPVIAWYFGFLGASGFNTLFGFLNSFVHIWMYLYYGLAALGPSIQKYLWWKKYLTTLQMLQFCLVTLASVSVIVTPGCKVSSVIIAMNLVPALFFLVLFAHFYRKSYRSHRKSEDINGRKLSTTISQDLNGNISELKDIKLSHND